jgi:hypothetical protein
MIIMPIHLAMWLSGTRSRTWPGGVMWVVSATVPRGPDFAAGTSWRI